MSCPLTWITTWLSRRESQKIECASSQTRSSKRVAILLKDSNSNVLVKNHQQKKDGRDETRISNVNSLVVKSSIFLRRLLRHILCEVSSFVLFFVRHQREEDRPETAAAYSAQTWRAYWFHTPASAVTEAVLDLCICTTVDYVSFLFYPNSTRNAPSARVEVR